MFFFVCLMALCASALSFQPQPAPSETERENDAYRIYTHEPPAHQLGTRQQPAISYRRNHESRDVPAPRCAAAQ